MADGDTEKNSVASDIAVDVLYAIAIGINVYVIMDQVTDGAVSRSVSTHVLTLRHKLATWAEKRRQYRKDLGHMLWQAHETMEDK